MESASRCRILENLQEAQPICSRVCGNVGCGLAATHCPWKGHSLLGDSRVAVTKHSVSLGQVSTVFEMPPHHHHKL